MGGTPSYPTPPTDKAIFVPATGQSAGGTRDVSGMSNPLRAASGSSASSILGAGNATSNRLGASTPYTGTALGA